MTYKVGDRVEYVPHLCHAFNCNGNNEYPWVIALRKNPRYEKDAITGERMVVEDLEELEEGRLHRNVLAGIHQAPNINEAKALLVPMRPTKLWPAVVRGVSDDGTLDLDIESNIGRGMNTLHYDRVPIDESGSTPHSCRRKEK